jgi:hypothetical protein
VASSIENEMTEETVEHALGRLKGSLLPSFEIGGLFSRNPTAHKWKATFRSLLLREAVFWRLEDLLRQSYAASAGARSGCAHPAA